MKAITQDRYGPPDVLTSTDIDRPVARDTEVLVRVHAAAANPADFFMMTGVPYVFFRPAFGLRKPRDGVRGTDLAGTVEAVGSNVTRFKPGDEVFGEGRGTFAEYAVARADKLAPKPASLTFEQAAAVPMAACVALQALRDHAKVEPGQRVLVNGAAGGIGTFAVQIAKWLGAEVTGVCSTRNVELVRSIGADQVIDYTREDFTRGEHRYHVILDNVANHSLSALRRVLTPTGTLLSNNGSSGGRWLGVLPRLAKERLVSPFVRQRLPMFVSTAKQEDLATLAELLEAGTIAPVIDRTYPLGEAPDAMRLVRTGHARGKVVITV
jgi:NADPH:quinone reductase-like Zn-dependent oxidoreductase